MCYFCVCSSLSPVARLGSASFDLDGPFSAMRVYVVRCRCVIFIICDWLKSVIYGISASDMHACMRLCMMLLWYDGYPHPSIYLSLHSSIHLHTRESEFQMKLSKPWHKQYKHLQTSSSNATSTSNWIDCISAHLILGTGGCGFFSINFPISNASPTQHSPSSSFLFRELIEKCVQIPIVILCMEFPTVTVLTYT